MSTFLDYLSLLILIAGLTLVFYGFIYIHDLPYKIAKKRHHPHAEAIHVATWLSLFTLHAIWPIVYIWSVMHGKPDEEGKPSGKVEPITAMGNSADVGMRLARLEQRLKMVGILEPDAN
jgi:hypothetical protein